MAASQAVIVGHGHVTMTVSDDGFAWKSAEPQVFNRVCRDIVWCEDKNLWLAVGDGLNNEGGRIQVATSPDLTIWRSYNLFDQAGYVCAHGAGLLVVGGFFHLDDDSEEVPTSTLAYSEDGCAWVSVPFTVVPCVWVTGISYSANHNLWVIIGEYADEGNIMVTTHDFASFQTHKLPFDESNGILIKEDRIYVYGENHEEDSESCDDSSDDGGEGLGAIPEDGMADDGMGVGEGEQSGPGSHVGQSEIPEECRKEIFIVSSCDGVTWQDLDVPELLEGLTSLAHVPALERWVGLTNDGQVISSIDGLTFGIDGKVLDEARKMIVQNQTVMLLGCDETHGLGVTTDWTDFKVLPFRFNDACFVPGWGKWIGIGDSTSRQPGIWSSVDTIKWDTVVEPRVMKTKGKKVYTEVLEYYSIAYK